MIWEYYFDVNDTLNRSVVSLCYMFTHRRIYIVASELNDPICHSNECQIGSFSSEATICAASLPWMMNLPAIAISLSLPYATVYFLFSRVSSPIIHAYHVRQISLHGTVYDAGPALNQQWVLAFCATKWTAYPS